MILTSDQNFPQLPQPVCTVNHHMHLHLVFLMCGISDCYYPQLGSANIMWRPCSFFHFTLLRISHIPKLKICLEKQSPISVGFSPCTMFINRLQEASNTRCERPCEMHFFGILIPWRQCFGVCSELCQLIFFCKASKLFISPFTSCLPLYILSPLYAHLQSEGDNDRYSVLYTRFVIAAATQSNWQPETP